MSYRVWRKRWTPKQGWEQHPREFPTFVEAAEFAQGCRWQNSVVDVAVLPDGVHLLEAEDTCVSCRGHWPAPSRAPAETCSGCAEWDRPGAWVYDATNGTKRWLCSDCVSKWLGMGKEVVQAAPPAVVKPEEPLELGTVVIAGGTLGHIISQGLDALTRPRRYKVQHGETPTCAWYDAKSVVVATGVTRKDKP
jgi:hypothetical protein